MSKKKQPPIGFGRAPEPTPEGSAEQPTERPLPPPLAEPVFVDDVVMLEFFARYNLHPLAPVSKFEYQLVCLAAGLEQRIRELDPDA